MYLSKHDIEQSDRKKRINIINSVSGIKAGNLVGTKSNSGQPNLAIINSVMHIGSDPALMGFVMRPVQDFRRDTFENIQENGLFTINQIHSEFIENAHYTSGKFEKGISEFQACNLNEQYLDDFHAPYVKESALKIGLRNVENVQIQSNSTVLVIGQIEHLYVPDEVVDKRGFIDLERLDSVGIGGLNSYYSLTKLKDFSEVRLNSIPDFKSSALS